MVRRTFAGLLASAMMVTVSYTHLDVYKRQVQKSVCYSFLSGYCIQSGLFGFQRIRNNGEFPVKYHNRLLLHIKYRPIQAGALRFSCTHKGGEEICDSLGVFLHFRISYHAEEWA